MEERCDTCCRWQKHFYREHHDAKGKKFLEVMKGDFFSGMIIPGEFTKQCKVELAGAVDLKGPSGYTWHVKVKLRKAGDYMFYGSDWEQFLLKNQVERGDFLVFTYEGDSHFSVMMFDASGLEKISPYFVKRCSIQSDTHHTEESEDRNVTSLGSSSNTASEAPLSTPESCRYKNKRKKYAQETAHNTFCSKQVKKEVNKEVNKAAEGNCATEKINCSSVFVSKRRPVTDAERARALQRASEIRLPNPSFLVVMKPTHVCRRFFMTITQGFAEKYISPRRQTITLRLPKCKREWHVTFINNKPRVSRGISGLAWMQFVYDNNLEEGDACVFERTRSSEGLVMDVHIFRVVEETVSLAVRRRCDPEF